MTPGDIAFAIVLPVMAALAIWYYPHCARPPLAFGSAPKLAFWVCLAATFVFVVGCLILWLDTIADPLDHGATQPVIASMMVAWILLGVALLKPRWFRILGPEDETTAPRFLLTWFRREWRRLEDDPQRLRLTQMLEVELEKVREPANAAFIDSWTRATSAFTHGAGFGWTSSNRERLALEKRLEGVVPVDPLARWL